MEPARSEYTLLLVTSGFPFGSGEPFIDNEIELLRNEFGKIIIVSQDLKGTKRVNISGEIKIYRYGTSTSLRGFSELPRILLANLKKMRILWNDEVCFRKSNHISFTFGNSLTLLKRIIKALQLGDYIGKVLNLEGTDKKIIIYSYWLNTGAHAAALFDKPGFLKIARAHGSDLYEETSPSGFLPLLHYCSDNLDSIFFVSEDGLRYFSSKFTGAKTRLAVSKLGVRTGRSGLPRKDESDRFVIVSCSNIIPLKRIDLIIKSLAIIRSGRKILWIHYGEGYLKDDTVKLAAAELDKKNSIQYEFRGQVPNEQIMKFYCENRVDLFINTSLTEGLPVSIMEAQLYGIPAIATDVGGVREVVTAETGKLVTADINPREIASIIEDFIEMPPEKYSVLRESCRNHCLKNFDADTNYTGFILKVNSILASRRESEM